MENYVKNTLRLVSVIIICVLYQNCTRKPIQLTECETCHATGDESVDSIVNRLSEAIDGVYYDFNSLNGDTIIIKGNMFNRIGSVNDSSLIHFFDDWNQSMRSHSHRDFDEKDVLKNICDVYVNLSSGNCYNSKYILIQPTIKYDILDSYFIGLDDCIELETRRIKKMKTLNDFRPRLSSQYKNRILYTTDAYKQAFDSILNNRESLGEGFTDNKRQEVYKFINVYSDEDLHTSISSEYYLSYIVFNKTMNTAIVEVSTSSWEYETWLINKLKNGRWKFKERLSFLAI